MRDLLADVYAGKGMYAEAIEEKRRSLILSGDDEAADILGTEHTADGYQGDPRFADLVRRVGFGT